MTEAKLFRQSFESAGSIRGERPDPPVDGAAFANAPGGTWVVVVAFRRDRELARLLSLLAKQTKPIAGVFVVDNADLPSTAGLCQEYGACYIGSKRNLGGAGGFTVGIMMALTQGAQHIWLWDDDGFPENDKCLEILLDASKSNEADLVSPLVVNDLRPEETAFPFRLNGKRVTCRRQMQQLKHIKNFVHLFNGALIRADAFERYGLPDYRFFIRGDEVDFMHRYVRLGAVVFTCTEAVALHPSGAGDVKEIAGLPFGVVVPANPDRQEITYRNRAQILRRNKFVLLQVGDFVRYSLYFLARKRPDLKGFRSWLAATRQGNRDVIGRQSVRPTSRRDS
jgi:rhamnopyranosyl-N-acetylglucosaminyl-diphospho-decaprenol beta-1,3/1,4-galactofuranosyltransferase